MRRRYDNLAWSFGHASARSQRLMDDAQRIAKWHSLLGPMDKASDS